jgi:outer membrane protein TolC
VAAILIAVLGGCSASPKPLTYLGHADLEYYKGLATKIDYPTKAGAENVAALASQAPPLVRHPRKDQLWDMSLGQAIHIALANNKIIRSREQLQLPRNPLLSNPDQIPSVFDPALQETGILFGQRGVEAALSDFDATFSVNSTWGSQSQIENNAGLSGVPLVSGIPTLVEDTAQFRARLDKTFADSSQISFINEWDYLQNNVIGNLFPSVYTGFARFEYRRPLLAGGGTEYTRIAGPINKNTVGVGQGVVISRINGDIALADFEASVHQLIRDVQSSYWDLTLTYQTYHAQMLYWHSALRTWRQVSAKTQQGISGGSAPDETQARENYYDAKGQAEAALSNLYTTEGQFRRLLGLSVNDGRIIRPCDEPSVAEFIPDWHVAVAEGITRRPEIRRQKWNIKSLELQLCAANNLVQPRVDFVAGGQVNAFGDRLISQQSQLNQPGSSAFASLVEANQTGWNLGFEASIAIGYRQQHSQVRNYELRLARARVALATQELDVSHEVRNAFQALDRSYAVAQSAFNRRIAAAERVAAYKAQYELRGNTIDPLLRAQQSLVAAEVAYDQSLAQYNQAITDFYYRTGSILEESNISIAEDMWDPKAYSDALREAWARSHGAPNPFVKTEPPEFVVPPGRPTGALPPIGMTMPSAMPSQQIVPTDGTTPNPPANPRPTPQPPPLPAQPAHTAQMGAMDPLPVWPQSAISGAQFVAPVGGTTISMPMTANTVATPFFSPELGLSGASHGDAKLRAAAVAPAVFETPTPLPAASVISPSPIGAPNAWSMPQVEHAASRGASAGDEIAPPASDGFDMPVNQLPRN